MKPMVVFFALVAVACGSLVPLAQPAHHPALVLDPHGRPLDTAEVINARALHLQAKALDGHYYGNVAHAAVVAPLAHSVAVAPAVVAAPAAVSHQSRVDVRHSPAIVSHAIAAPVYSHAAPVYSHAAPVYSQSAYGYAAPHYLHKRSLGHYAYAAPAYVAAPSAVSHQSRVDVISSPAVVSHAVAAPVLAHAAPVVAVAPAAVSHQSRVDVRTSPAVYAHAAVVPVAHHGALARINHAAVAPIAHAVPAYSTYNSYNHAAPLVHAW